MNIKHLECFCALAETLNFTKAAKQVYITQPAFSKIIASLEKELDCLLFTRSKTAPALTEAGIQIYERARNVIYEIKEIEKIAKQNGRTERITLQIGILWGGLHKRERLLINEYSIKHENVSFEINEYSVNDLFRAIDLENIDFAICIGQWQPHLEKYRHTSIQSDPCCLICNRHHKFAQRTSVNITELKNESFILLNKKRAVADAESLTELCLQNGFQPKIGLLADSAFIVLDYVEQGMGVSFMGSDAITVSQRDLRAIPIKNMEPSHHWVLTRKGDDRPVIKDFLDFIKTSAGNNE